MHDELKGLWERLLGTAPEDAQFEIWTALHSPEVVKNAILKTGAKDLSLGRTMTADYKVRFASKVMLVQSERNAANALNRAKLEAEFGPATHAAGQ